MIKLKALAPSPNHVGDSTCKKEKISATNTRVFMRYPNSLSIPTDEKMSLGYLSLDCFH